VPEQVEMMENGAKFLVPVMDGQKTGWFYDHRDGRAQLQRWAKGKRVLDVFSYIGGWGVQALVAGASEAVLIDSSEPALNMAIENAKLNDCVDRITTVQGQALDAMRELIAAGEKFDAVVVDPPAFIKRRKDMSKGEQGYRRVNELAMRLVDKEGLLVSASCSLHLTRDALTDVVRGASRHIDRETRIVATTGLGADHPVPPAIPETDYLKTLFCRVLPAD
jgi:23S rRNA (cytosine1962-C5)-methyltransferase